MARGTKKKDGFWETMKTVFWALVIAMVFRSALYQPFSIPSGSMKPSLLVGDYLFVSKFSYGYSKYSLPFSPNLFDGRIWGTQPERGDVVVFKKPGEDKCTEGPIGWGIRMASYVGSWVRLTRPIPGPNDCTDYIKRVVGLPGDRIQVTEGVLHVNGERVGLKRAPAFVERKGTNGEYRAFGRCLNAPVPQGGACEYEHWIEELPGGRKHSILNLGQTRVDNTGEFVVKEGYFFFMGDNRDNSVDSRFADVGQVPFQNLIGRAEMIAISSEGSFISVWKWRFGRLFKSID